MPDIPKRLLLHRDPEGGIYWNRYALWLSFDEAAILRDQINTLLAAESPAEKVAVPAPGQRGTGL